MPNMVVVGSTNTDLVIQSPRLPTPGETVLGGVFATYQGGKGANQAVAAARAGAHVTFLARVGNDLYGQTTLTSLKNEGIDTEFLKIDEKHPSGVALIIVDAQGENQIVVAPGANATLTSSDIADASEILEQADVILAQLEIPLAVVEALADWADKLGKPFVLNPAPATTLPPSLLEKVDYLTPNTTELEILSDISIKTLNDIEMAATSLLSRGVENIIVTQGREGCLVFTPDDKWWHPALSVTPIDTVGAGDCFTANLAVAIAEGKDLHQAVQFATAAAAISVTRLGAQPSMPYRYETDSFLRGEK